MKAIFIALLLFLGLVVVAQASSVGWSAVSKWQLTRVQPNRTYDIGQGYAFNPGSSRQCYVMDVAYISEQREKRPPAEWVLFTPSSFCLEAGQGVLVDIDLFVAPEIKMDGGLKGDYFAFIGPCTYDGNIGACVASKLYFTVGN